MALASVVMGASVLVGSCASTAEVGNLEVHVYSGSVLCDPDEQLCRDDEGEVVTPERHRPWAFVSTESSVHDEGVLLYFELRRGDAATAVVELDVPVAPEAGRVVAGSFIETRAGVETFHSETLVGRIRLPKDLLGEDCPCPDGRFELTFLDVGPDGEVGTADDDQRVLSSAVFGSAEGLCLRPEVLPAYREGVAVTVVDRCPTPPARSSPPTSSAPRDPPRSPSSGGADCGGGEASCDGDSCEGSPSSGGGCEGDSSGDSCEGDSSSGGSCEGDSSGSSCDSGGSGCDSGGTTCDADGAAALPTLRPPRGCHGPTRVPLSGRAQLLFLFIATMLHLRYRARGATLTHG